MAIPDNLLNPIPGDNPSGQNLRYSPEYEKIKEARQEEEDLPQGDWARAVKSADPILVTKLATTALATKTKDLQLAAWLTEALFRREGIGGLKDGLDLLCGLVANFWETVYPEAEDGDLELRAAPLNWVGSYMGEQVKKTPLTRSKFDWHRYVESQAVGYEESCAGSDARMAARQSAIAEHKLAPEVFDEDVSATPREFYEQLFRELDGALASLMLLDGLCEEKLGRDAPSFTRLRTALEDVQSFATVVLKRKLPPKETHIDESLSVEADPARVDKLPMPVSPKEPNHRNDAISRVVTGAKYLRNSEPHNPASYLILRGLVWGELRGECSSQISMSPEAPSSETRQQLKQLARGGNWHQLIEAAETALTLPGGKVWLDLQRYVVKACEELGSEYDAVGNAVGSATGELISDLPELTQSIFMDDTPVANADTLRWCLELVKPTPVASQTMAVMPEIIGRDSQLDGEVPVIDAQTLALQAARSGQVAEAIEIMAREIAEERSGRARFERRTQLADLCLSFGYESIAYPILRELAEEVDQRRLEEWESPTVITRPLTLLFGFLAKTDGNSDERKRVYERICRLDPVQALACLK